MMRILTHARSVLEAEGREVNRLLHTDVRKMISRHRRIPNLGSADPTGDAVADVDEQTGERKSFVNAEDKAGGERARRLR